MRKGLADALASASNAPGTELAEAALVIARIEYPQLDAPAYLARLDRMGDAARRRIERQVDESGDGSTLSCIKGLNAYLFDDQRFVGNRDRYDDPRNSCLNEVLDRRTGIPITLSVVYVEIGRRAGLRVDGINFPGHFLVRFPEDTSRRRGRLIIDPFDGGSNLSEHDCRLLLQKHVGSEVAFSKSLLAPATRSQIIVRMLLNLKRLYVHMRSFPQAPRRHRAAAGGNALGNQRAARSRPAGLPFETTSLARFATCRCTSRSPAWARSTRKRGKNSSRSGEHVKTLRRRIASLN